MAARTRVAGLVAAGTVLCAAACGGNPAPAPLDTGPASPSTAASTDSPSPTDAASPRQETASEFIRRWAGVKDAFTNSGDGVEFRSLGYECDSCARYAREIDTIYRRGGWAHTRGWTVTGVRAASGQPGGFIVRIDAGAERFKVSESRPAVRAAAVRGARWSAVLVRRGVTWRMHSFLRLSS